MFRNICDCNQVYLKGEVLSYFNLERPLSSAYQLIILLFGFFICVKHKNKVEQMTFHAGQAMLIFVDWPIEVVMRQNYCLWPEET